LVMVIGVGDRLSGHREQSTSDCNRNHTDLLAAIYKQMGWTAPNGIDVPECGS